MVVRLLLVLLLLRIAYDIQFGRLTHYAFDAVLGIASPLSAIMREHLLTSSGSLCFPSRR